MSAAMEESGTYSRPIGGWLLLYLILAVSSFALYVWGVVKEAPVLMEILTLPTGTELVFSVSLFIGQLVKLMLLLIIFMKWIPKKRAAVRMVILFEALCILLRILALTWIAIDFEFHSAQWISSSLAILSSIIWIWYFYKSKRVRETFVHP